VETSTDIPGGQEPATSDYVAETSFDDLHLSDPVRQGVAERGYVRPTPVQVATFRPIMEGRDLIVRSKTGTGKTAAFGIPILEKLPAGRRRPSALIMCPTRELALQVAEEIAALGKHKDLSVVAIYGGAPMGEQLDRLSQGAEIVVGTPGRIYDHIRRGTLKLDGALVSCLDEADEMLNMGFFEEVTRILDHLPDDCQQFLFSATVPEDIQQLIRDYLRDPETILLSGDEYSVENIHNVIYPTVEAYPKPRNLLYMIEAEEPDSAIVFCNTRSDTGLITAVLNRNGYDAELLNGELPQKERERVMAKVKRGELRFMVATDIAARGIDISDLSHVINYSLPEDPSIYLHRVGRTGRIGKKGTALSLVSGAEMMTLKALQTRFGIAFEEKKLPEPDEARRQWTERHVTELKEAMSSTVFEAYIPLAQSLKTRADGDWLIAFALKYFFSRHRMERVRDQVKAEHKREEHERRERPADAGEGRKRNRREGRERGERRGGEGRVERAERRGAGRAARGGAEGREEGREEGRAGIAGEGRTDRDAAQVVVDLRRAEPDAAASAQGEARPSRSRVFLTLGQKDGADEAKVRAAVAALAPDLALLAVDVRANHSFLQVAPDDLERSVAALNGKEFEGKALTAEKARRRRR
jgi:ATP-dependent RNA helicase DeaD